MARSLALRLARKGGHCGSRWPGCTLICQNWRGVVLPMLSGSPVTRGAFEEAADPVGWSDSGYIVLENWACYCMQSEMQILSCVKLLMGVSINASLLKQAKKKPGLVGVLNRNWSAFYWQPPAAGVTPEKRASETGAFGNSTVISLLPIKCFKCNSSSAP